MKLEEVIQKTIEGGYVVPTISIFNIANAFDIRHCVLDPKFWQSFGKAMGWGYTENVDPSEHHSQEEWLDQWHNFIDHLAEGKDIESFFEQF